MIAKMGDKQIAFVTTLMVPDNQEAIVEADFWVGGEPPPHPGGVGFNVVRAKLYITCKFIDGEGDVTYTFRGAYIEITFRGWKNPMGNAIVSPIKVGTINSPLGQVPFGLSVASHYVSPINIVTLQIVTGGTYDESR